MIHMIQMHEIVLNCLKIALGYYLGNPSYKPVAFQMVVHLDR